MAFLRVVSYFYFFLVLCYSAFGDDLVETTFPGGCPKVEGLAEFDEKKILGLSFLSNVAGSHQLSWVRCLKVDVAKESENLFLRFDSFNASGLVQSGNFTLIPIENSLGRFSLKAFKDDKPVTGFSSIVIEDEFFMVWNCCQHDDKETHREAAFVQTFGKRPPEDVLKKFQQFLDSHNSSLKNAFAEVPELNC